MFPQHAEYFGHAPHHRHVEQKKGVSHSRANPHPFQEGAGRDDRRTLHREAMHRAKMTEETTYPGNE